jgi:hypothetical protein
MKAQMKATPGSVADSLWEMLEKAGVKRCYGIVGDALNPVIDALHRNGKIEFIHVRHEEYGGLAAVADAYFTGKPVAVCGTAGPGVTHLFNGLMDARKEGARVAPEIGVCSTRMASSKPRTQVRKNSAGHAAKNCWNRTAEFLLRVSQTPSSTASPVFQATTPPARRRTTLLSSSSTFSRTLGDQEEFNP